MKRYLIAAIACLALTFGAGTATAGGGLVTTATQVVQQNTNLSGDATASNENGNRQSNDQSQVGSGGEATSGDASSSGSGNATSGDATGGDVTQSQDASNSNATEQNATAKSKATQIAPVNANVPICVSFKCSNGDVHQSNENTSGDAHAYNTNRNKQSNEQSQTGTGGNATSGDATAHGNKCCNGGWKDKPKCDEDRWAKSKDGCDKPKPRPCGCEGKHGGNASSGDAYGGDVDQTQYAQNDNRTTQRATAKSVAKQVEPTNLNLTWFKGKRGPKGCDVC